MPSGTYHAMATGMTVTPPTTAQDVREASLRTRAEAAAAFIHQAHDVMASLEDAIHGCVPRAAQQGKEPDASQRPGLREVVESLSTESALLVGRLSTLLASL